MKILQIIPSYKPAYIYGGPIRSVAALNETLVVAGHDVTVFTTPANGKEELNVQTNKEYTIDGVKVRYFKRWTGDHSNISPGIIRNVYLKCKMYDIIHIQSWWNFIALCSAMVCIWKGVLPIISTRGSVTKFTFENSRNKLKRLLHATIGRRLLNKSIVHVTSQHEKSEFVKYCTGKKIVVIPNLLELPQIIYSKPRNDGILKLVFVGRIDPAKNLELLLKILTEKLTVPFKLNIIGAGKPEYIQKLKAETLNHSYIIWHGEKDGDEKYMMLAESDILVLPSITENFGNVVIEALSQGTPVLISRGVGAKDFVIENKLGWVLDFDESIWSHTLNTIRDEKAELDRIRSSAPAIVRSYFNTKVQIAKYVEMYESVVNRNTYVF